MEKRAKERSEASLTYKGRYLLKELEKARVREPERGINQSRKREATMELTKDRAKTIKM